MKAESRYADFIIEIEERSEGKMPTIRGRAIVFNQMSNDLGGFREIIAPSALDKCDMRDVIACFNHKDELLLGRTSSGTLRLEVRADGLYYTIDLPNNSAGLDCAESVRRKDIAGSSFRFFTEADDWAVADDGTVVRTITALRAIKDVSPVVFPAYMQTDVAVRSMQDWKEKVIPVKDVTTELYSLKTQLAKLKL